MRKLGEYLVKYQDPCQADSLSRLQADVEDTTQILVSCQLIFSHAFCIDIEIT